MGHEVASIAIGHAGDVVRYKGIDIYPAANQYMLAKTLSKFKPDIVMHIRDNWVFIPKYAQGAYTLIPMVHNAGARLINFTPVQATPLPPEFVDSITTQADLTLITNQYGLDSLIKQGAPAERLGLLYSGVDVGTYRPLTVQRKPELIPVNKKLAIFVGANMDYRKQIPRVLKAFQTYLARRDDAFLYMHTNPYGGFDVPLFVRNLGLEKKVLLKSNEGAKLMTWDLTPEEMASMYNAGDAYITLTAAEGFNAPALEALACGLPVVLTDTPIHREVFEKFGEQVAFVPSRQDLPTVWAFEWAADTDRAAELLEKAFDRGKKGANGAALKDYTWKQIARKFEKQCQQVMEMPITKPELPKPVSETEKKQA